jgi:hypothetical protein
MRDDRFLYAQFRPRESQPSWPVPGSLLRRVQLVSCRPSGGFGVGRRPAPVPGKTGIPAGAVDLRLWRRSSRHCVASADTARMSSSNSAKNSAPSYRSLSLLNDWRGPWMTISSILEDVSAANEIDNEVRYDDENG